MIQYIKGSFAGRFKSGIVVDANNIGYIIFVSDNSSLYLKEEGQEVKVHTRMIVREDDISIYGFADREELELFDILITVNGVGAKAALSILSVLPPIEVKKAIIFEDIAMLTRANGIGKKTASRILLELKDKFDKDSIGLDGKVTKGYEEIKTNSQREEALMGLIALGYTRNEGITGLSRVEGEGLSSDEYIKRALSNLL